MQTFGASDDLLALDGQAFALEHDLVDGARGVQHYAALPADPGLEVDQALAGPERGELA